jgi:hypothetical protein
MDRRLLAERPDLERDIAPGRRRQSLVGECPDDRPAARGGAGARSGQERHDHAGQAALGLAPAPRRPAKPGQELACERQEHARAVARGSIGTYRSTVTERRKAGQGQGHDASRRVTAAVRDEADATGVVLESSVVERVSSGWATQGHRLPPSG